MKKFELFLGCLGNGTTVCNKAIEENGDYKKIAHISEYGKITFYVKPTSIPGDALLKIEHHAHTAEANFDKFLNGMPLMQRYGYLLERVPLNVFLDCLGMETSLEEKVAYLKKEYWKVS